MRERGEGVRGGEKSEVNKKRRDSCCVWHMELLQEACHDCQLPSFLSAHWVGGGYGMNISSHCTVVLSGGTPSFLYIKPVPCSSM